MPEDFDLKICDFGLSLALEMSSSNKTNTVVLSGPGSECDFTRAPPEFLQFNKTKKEGDVWAFGIVCWEIFSLGMAEWYGLALLGIERQLQVQALLKAVLEGFRPPFDSNALEFEIPASMKCLLADCWLLEAATRPRFTDIVERLEAILKTFK
jgi:serine/threonine protein kinase